MAWRIDKQPDGRFARFSDIVDNFTHLNMSEEEARDTCLVYCGWRAAIRKVKNAVDDIKPWTNIPGCGTDRWDYDIDKVMNIHGQAEVNRIISETQAE